MYYVLLCFSISLACLIFLFCFYLHLSILDFSILFSLSLLSLYSSFFYLSFCFCLPVQQIIYLLFLCCPLFVFFLFVYPLYFSLWCICLWCICSFVYSYFHSLSLSLLVMLCWTKALSCNIMPKSPKLTKEKKTEKEKETLKEFIHSFFSLTINLPHMWYFTPPHLMNFCIS